MGYNKELLQEIINRDEASNIYYEGNLNRDTKIKFNCKCGEKHIKSFRRCNSNNMYCKNCTQKENIKKGLLTKNNNLSKEQKLNKIYNNWYNLIYNIIENKNKIWRDNLIKNTHYNEKIKYFHPKYKNYYFHNNNIYNNTTKKCIQGTKAFRGHITITINKQKNQKHRFIMECIYGEEIPIYFDIDHINTNPSNNNIINLQILTRKEHAKKTTKDNPLRGIKSNQPQSRKLLRHNNLEKCYFKSLNEAICKTNIGKKQINKCIELNKKDKEGYLWEEIQDVNSTPKLDSEIFVDAKGFEEYIQISNYGRVKFKRNNYITYGSINSNGYYTIHLKKQHIKVHNLVATNFICEKNNKNDTVDHIDNNKINNHFKNLRWADKQQQSINRTNIRKVEVYNKYTQEIIKTYKTMQEISDTYNVKNTIVGYCVKFSENSNNRGKNLGKYKNLSVRYCDLSNDEKKNRELYILQHDLDVLKLNKNKRKQNLDLPIHITQTKSGTYVLNITFRGKKYRKCSNNINDLIEHKTNFLKKEKLYYTNIINKIYN